jgi:hypothetical protein
VLPGVTVEAASPALIEKVRAAVTDGEGRYNIGDLRPGSYVVTFSLVGFSTFKREGIALRAGFTATVNADMPVGAIEETITVTGAAPLVDAQTVRQQEVISSELLAQLPSSSKSMSNIATLIPGMNAATDVGGSAGIYVSNSGSNGNNFHGKSGSRVTYDGLNTRAAWGDGSALGYIPNPATALETAVETGGISPESSQALMINLIPKDGGNTFSGSVAGTYSGERLQMDNMTDALRARGVTTASKVLRFYDTHVAVGGRIVRDRLWFFASSWALGTRSQRPGVFFNKTKGTPFYTPDLARPAYRQEWLQSAGNRLTWQVSEKNKVSVYGDLEGFFNRGRGDFASPEAYGAQFNLSPMLLVQGTWSSPRTDKLLLEAGASYTGNRWPYPSPGDQKRPEFAANSTEDISILELSTNFRYNAKSYYSDQDDEPTITQRFSASYVTGSHTFKAGVQLQESLQATDLGTRPNRDVTYEFLQGVPNRINQFAPSIQQSRLFDLGLFAQDRWTLKRLTLNYGLRFEWMKGWVPAQHVPATRFLPERDFAAVHDIPNWKDLNPRVGASYDLFGTGRTAIRVSLGRFSESQGIGFPRAVNPLTTSVTQVARTWSDANVNYEPDCDLQNFATNGECGPISDRNFGQNNPNATRYADEVLGGGLNGTRGYIWDVSTEVQHELRQGISITAGYYHNWASNFRATDNLVVTPEDFSPYCITAPVDARLPGGGGYPVCGLFDVAPSKFGQVENIVAKATHYYADGDEVTCGLLASTACGISDFVGVNLNTRLGSGIQLGGGVDTGRTVRDSCFTVDSPQQRLNCHVVIPFRAQTQIKLFGTYPLPGDFVVSGTLQNRAGAPIEAIYAARNAEIAPSLGRNLAACGAQAVCSATALVPLYAPWTEFEPRRTQLDLRLSKVLKLGPRARLQANVDIYNALNSSAVLGVNSRYGASWRQPTNESALTQGVESIMPGRLFHLGASMTF